MKTKKKKIAKSQCFIEIKLFYKNQRQFIEENKIKNRLKLYFKKIT